MLRQNPRSIPVQWVRQTGTCQKKCPGRPSLVELSLMFISPFELINMATFSPTTRRSLSRLSRPERPDDRRHGAGMGRAIWPYRHGTF